MNQGIHTIDLLQWFMGPVVEVRAFTARLAHTRIEVEDAAVAAIRFKNGALGVIEGATSAWPGHAKKIFAIDRLDKFHAERLRDGR